MPYQAVLFDMDGTVLDTLEDLTDAVNVSLNRFNLPEVSFSHVRKNLGHGARYLIAHCLPSGCEDAFITKVLDFYRPWYDSHCRVRTAPYAGMPELMQEFRAAGILLAVISNKPDAAVRELADAFFPNLLFCAVGEREGNRIKPYPDAVFDAVRQLGIPREQCVYVGDSEVDIQTAANAGMDMIAVAWGFRDEDDLIAAGAEIIVHNMEELKERIMIHG